MARFFQKLAEKGGCFWDGRYTGDPIIALKHGKSQIFIMSPLDTNLDDKKKKIIIMLFTE